MMFRLYVLPRFGAVPLDAITQREVRAWVTSLTAKGLSPATVHKAYQLFAKAMAAAVDAGTVDVAETVVEVEGRLLFGPPKTRAGRRRIRLPRRVVDELALHLRAPGRPTDPVFRSPAGGPLRVTAFRGRIWRPATLAAGLPGLRIHDLRHTAVALWIAAGASPKEVAVWAGHTSTSFVLDRYGHLFPESDAALCDRLDALFVSQESPSEPARLSATRTVERVRCCRRSRLCSRRAPGCPLERCIASISASRR
jgi:hypothetical protein